MDCFVVAIYGGIVIYDSLVLGYEINEFKR